MGLVEVAFLALWRTAYSLSLSVLSQEEGKVIFIHREPESSQAERRVCWGEGDADRSDASQGQPESEGAAPGGGCTHWAC